MKKTKKTILVTGGAGFIGSNFVRYFYNNYPQYKIIILDLLTYSGEIENIPSEGRVDKRIEFWYGDINNGDLVSTLIKKSDIVVHFAAETHVTRSIYNNRIFFETDVMGTHCIANAVSEHRKNIERFIHISSSEVYGTAKTKLMNEEHPLNPLSPYSSAKVGSDRLVYSYWQTYDMPAVIIRPFNNYGPYQHLEKVIPRFITSCFLNEPLTVHGDGTAKRDWLYVKDLCKALDKVIHADLKKIKGQVINIASGQSIDIITIAHIVRKMMNKPKISIQHIGDRPGQVFRHTASIEKAKRLINWRPEVDFEKGLTKTIEWYKNSRKWWEKQLWMRHIPIITKEGKRQLH